ncbi:hypothetical protein HGB07_02600 [Candidatus Roizmanbacteria bacterium]|nr:hypothetical protein [Candidatus Roizmanbacteria bacterium]
MKNLLYSLLFGVALVVFAGSSGGVNAETTQTDNTVSVQQRSQNNQSYYQQDQYSQSNRSTGYKSYNDNGSNYPVERSYRFQTYETSQNPPEQIDRDQGNTTTYYYNYNYAYDSNNPGDNYSYSDSISTNPYSAREMIQNMRSRYDFMNPVYTEPYFTDLNY